MSLVIEKMAWDNVKMHSATWENTTSLLTFLSLITNGHIASMPQSNNMEREKGGYGPKQLCLFIVDLTW